MKTHVAFLHDEPLDEIMAGRKQVEFRLSYRGLACRSAREGDRLLLKRSGGEVEAQCDIGEVRFYRKLPPEDVAALARRYADGVSAPYFERYVAPNNPDRPVNLAIIELRDVRSATLPPEQTPRRVMSGWGPNFRSGEDVRKYPRRRSCSYAERPLVIGSQCRGRRWLAPTIRPVHARDHSICARRRGYRRDRMTRQRSNTRSRRGH
jgi:hypothetical protein